MIDVSKIKQQLRATGNPIIKGNRARIFWLGDDPPTIRGDHLGWETGLGAEMAQLDQQLWVHEAVLPSDSYIEYAFFRKERRVRDPLNPRRTPNGLGHINHYFTMPDYKPSNWHLPIEGVAKGKLTEHQLPTEQMLAGALRTVYLYQPPADEPTPLLIVYDGREYLERTNLPVMVENLIAARKIRPLALALVCNSKRSRIMEYACADSTLWYLLQVVIPFARNNLNLIDLEQNPGAYGILGASFGGLMALYTLLRLPHTFGRGLCQSGAYTVEDFSFPVWDLLEKIRGADVRIWMDCGRFDWLVETNRKMAAAVSDLVVPFHYHETNAGHNFPNWRDCLPHALEFLFPAKNPPDDAR